jgi:hypothetical protein
MLVPSPRRRAGAGLDLICPQSTAKRQSFDETRGTGAGLDSQSRPWHDEREEKAAFTLMMRAIRPPILPLKVRRSMPDKYRDA